MSICKPKPQNTDIQQRRVRHWLRQAKLHRLRPDANESAIHYQQCARADAEDFNVDLAAMQRLIDEEEAKNDT
jgi:hypothetical protein